MDIAYHFDASADVSATINTYFDASVDARASVTDYFDALVNVPYHNVRWADLTITLAANTLSDTYSGVTYEQLNALALNDVVNGSILDHNYIFKVEELSKSNGQLSITGRYNSDRLLYTEYSYELNTRDAVGMRDGVYIWNATQYFRAIAARLGLTPVSRFRDWPVKAGSLPGNGSYKQFLSGLFGWRSELPHITINVFIRGNVLYAVERGQERAMIDAGYGRVVTITDTENAVAFPSINQRIVRTEWSGTADWGSDIPQDSIVDEDPVPFTGTIQFGDSSLTYENGLLVLKIEGSKTTTYTYVTIDDKKYLSKEETVDSEEETADKTEYTYETQNHVVYLAIETRYTGGDVIVGGVDYSDAAIVKTTHVPLGNGWYGLTTVNEEDDEAMTSLVQGGSANEASIYTIERTQEAFGDMWAKTGENVKRILARLLGAPLVNTNWPVDSYFGGTAYQRMAHDCDWLNNKTEETITVDLVNLNHVIDFADLILYHGHYYCLDSNNVRVTPAGIRQSVTMVRWFAGNDSYPYR